MNELLNLSNDQSEERLLELFITLTSRFAEAARKSGVPVSPFNDSEPKYFQSLPPLLQISTLKNFHQFESVAHQMILDQEVLDAEHRFLWRMMRHLNMRPTNDLFGRLERDDVVEIYSVPDFIQIFRNLRFFKNCSYTLDDILCRPFWELYKRDEIITETITQIAKAVANQSVLKTVQYNLPPHQLKEIDSRERYICAVENKFISPLVNSNREIVAVVNVMSGEVQAKQDLETPMFHPKFVKGIGLE